MHVALHANCPLKIRRGMKHSNFPNQAVGRCGPRPYGEDTLPRDTPFRSASMTHVDEAFLGENSGGRDFAYQPRGGVSLTTKYRCCGEKQVP